jgi:CBS domain-containing protein
MPIDPDVGLHHTPRSGTANRSKNTQERRNSREQAAFPPHTRVSAIGKEEIMQVREAMSDDVRIASPNQSIRDAAILMAKIDAGSLPVGDNDRLVGMITDRDIAVRAEAKGQPSSTPVRQIMSSEVKYCYEDDDLGEVAQNMSDIQVRRLPVLNSDKRLVGIISLGDIAAQHEEEIAGEAICGISEPSDQHSQSAEGRV